MSSPAELQREFPRTVEPSARAGRGLLELLQAALEGSRRLFAEADFRTGVEGWLAEIVPALGAGRGFLGVFEDAKSPTLVALGQILWSRDDLPPGRQMEIPATRDFMDWRDRLLRGEVVAARLADLRDPASAEFWRANGGVHQLLLPVVVDGVATAWVCFEWPEAPRDISEFIPVVVTAVEGVAAAVKRRDAWEKAQAEREKLAAERAERIAAHNAVLRNSAARLSAAARFQDVIAASLAEMATFLGADASHLFVYDDRSNTLSLGLAWRGGALSSVPAASEPEIFGRPIDPGITRAFATLCRSRRYLSLSKGELDGLEWPGVLPWFKRQGFKQAVVLALMVGERPRGVLGFVFRREGELTDQQGELLYALAAQMALTLEFRRLADAMREMAVAREQEAAGLLRAAELARTNEALLRCTELLAEESDLHPFLCALMAETTALTGAKSAGVFSYDDRSDHLHMESFMTEGQPVSIQEDPRMELWRRPMPRNTSAAWVRQLRERGFGRITFAAEASLPADHPWKLSEAWHLSMGHREVVTVPLYAGGRMIGTFGQCFARPMDERSLDLNKTRLFASAAAVALQIARLSRAARRAAMEGAVLAERNRIARDLHDTLAQGFAGVLAQLGAAEGALELAQPRQVLHCLERARTLARGSLAEARTSVHALRPETSGRPMGERLRQMLGTMTEGTRLAATLEECGEVAPLSPVADWCVHKFAQETLANTVKHSGAARFHLELLWEEECLVVHATDDGIGFDHNLSGRGIGLALMGERATEAGGRVVCEHGTNGGASLRLEIPLTRFAGS
ncbi:MAG: GAF domain-containing protein [Verrucomicrobiales bacterium]|nr:GAF domain-containing protein [Verrucomicrobiales bacterium]